MSLELQDNCRQQLVGIRQQLVRKMAEQQASQSIPCVVVDVQEIHSVAQGTSG